MLGDSADPGIAALAASYGFSYCSRPDRGRFKKAGNLQYGFQRTTGEYILILDADFAPRSDLLAELLPYFADSRVGIVQSPQFFRGALRAELGRAGRGRGAGVVLPLGPGVAAAHPGGDLRGQLRSRPTLTPWFSGGAFAPSAATAC